MLYFFPDSGYTERYMGYPSSNEETTGYPEDSGLRTKGSSFQGKNLFLVHGSADDNVHIQNTDILSQALVKENIQFKLQVIMWYKRYSRDFLIKLGIKPRLHVLKISIFSLNHVIVGPNKIMNNLVKVCKTCTFKVISYHQK